jgi:PKD repeat protein
MLSASRIGLPLTLIAVVAVVLGLSMFASALPLGGAHVAAAPARGTDSSSFTVNAELALAHESLRGLPSTYLHPALPPPAPPPPISPGGFEWANLTPALISEPGARLAQAMAWDPADGYVLMYGGQNTAGKTLRDTWSFSNGTWTNLTGTVTGSPPPLVLAGLAYDPSGHQMILFGGANGSAVFQNQTWAYHDRVWTNLTGHTGGAAPPVAIFFGMATDSAASDIVLFGGVKISTSVWGNDTWTFHAGTWTNISATARAPAGQLVYATASDDPAIAGILLYALYILPGSLVPATLQFTGGTWQNLSGVARGDSGQLVYAQGGYLAPLGAVSLVSTAVWNISDTMVAGVHTVEYSDQNWTNVTSSVNGPPSIGVLGAIADLPSDSGLIAFGGEFTAGPTSNTWVLTAPPQLAVSVAHIVTDVGVSDAFNSTVTAGYGAISYHWSFGDGGNASTAGGSHTYAHPGPYQASLTVTDALGHKVSASVWVQVNGALTANVSASPSPATAGAPVALIGGWTGGTSPYSFAWTLGDLNSSTAASLAHVYAKAGNYSVSFRVTDALGQAATGTLTVEVRAAPASTSSSGSSSVSLTSGTGLYLLVGILVLAVIAIVLGVLLGRRPRSPPGPPAPYASAPPPASYGSPPPGSPPGS